LPARPWIGVSPALDPAPPETDTRDEKAIPMSTLADLISERFGIETETGRSMPGDGPLAGFLGHVTRRRYTDQPVDDDLLNVLLACAQSAPAKSDLQQFSIIVVRDAATRQAFADKLPNMPWVKEAPVFLVFCGDVSRGRKIAAMRGYPHANDNVDTFMNAAVDAALAMQALIGAANAAGLGCCPISHIRNDVEDAADLLGLPPGVFPVAGMCVGWPAGRAYVTLRLPPAVVVHQDRYDDSGLEDEVAAYDARRHARFPIKPESQRHSDKYGVLDVCTWSENVARQLSLPERDGFRAFLNGHGLSLD
jgi:nitroreductase